MARVTLALETPGKGPAGKPVPVDVSAHVEQTVSNPCLAIMYVDGPSDSITIYIGSTPHKLPKSNTTALAIYAPGEKQRCTYVNPSGPLSIVFPQQGKYTVVFAAGWIDPSNNTLTIDQQTSVTFTIYPPTKTPPALPTKTPKISIPKELTEFAPAIAGIIAGIATWRATGKPLAGLAAGVGAGLVTYGIKKAAGW